MFKQSDILRKASKGEPLTVTEHYILVHQMLDEIIQTGSKLIEKALAAKVSLDVEHDGSEDHDLPAYRMTQHESRLLGVRVELDDMKRGALQTLKERIKLLEGAVNANYTPDQPEPDRKKRK